jgi:hypothetical protein
MKNSAAKAFANNGEFKFSFDVGLKYFKVLYATKYNK